MQKKSRTSIHTFVKLVNHRHLMPTRYTLKLDISSVSRKKLDPKEGRRKRLRSSIKQKLEKKNSGMKEILKFVGFSKNYMFKSRKCMN